MLCHNCQHTNHITDNCKWLGKPKCGKCGWFGHIAAECRRGQKRKANDGGGGKWKQPRKEQAHHAAENGSNNDGGDLSDNNDNDMAFLAQEGAETCNFDNYSLNVEENGKTLSHYDWLADCATTSHITNMRDAFTTFQPLTKSVSGVGNAQACTQGRGTVKVKTKVNDKEFQLTLKDVLYIPNNPQNLLSLGRWDKAGDNHHGGQGLLTMNTKDGEPVIKGTQISNHLYKLNNFTIQQRGELIPTPTTVVPQTFNTTDSSKGWEVWHCRFWHLGKSSIYNLYKKQLVTSLDIDLQSPKYDCKTCTVANQTVKPFLTVSEKTPIKPGEVTHVDLWSKYSSPSIHGNYYFHTFLDDSTRRPTVRFLKHKHEAAQAIKDHVAHLRACRMHPNAFRCDEGWEFVNENLIQWLREQGIELQITAPYSSFQNGAAEHLNRTLVELAGAMLLGQQVPTFLWEYAIQHAAYLRECALAAATPGMTPYEAWHGMKPDVSHLREFGSPVYVLLQGRNVKPKLLPRSKQQIFVGFDSGSKSIKYYNPETRRVLTSRNYQFLSNLPKETGMPEPILVELPPTMLREGEHDDGNNDTLQLGSQHNKRKRQYEEPNQGEDTKPTNTEPPQRKLRTKTPVNYRHLNDPFSDEEDEDETYRAYSATIYQAVLGTDDPKTLHEARTFDDWPKWEKAIHVELDQLECFRTWKLVDCPSDAILIPNKWVFLKKYNKQGELTKHKARLVVKGCAQRPGFDYADTFSSVVRLETIRVILSIVPAKKLKIHQMDVKGAYLNGILKEKVYM